jgi:hypothetical protein
MPDLLPNKSLPTHENCSASIFYVWPKHTAQAALPAPPRWQIAIICLFISIQLYIKSTDMASPRPYQQRPNQRLLTGYAISAVLLHIGVTKLRRMNAWGKGLTTRWRPTPAMIPLTP